MKQRILPAAALAGLMAVAGGAMAQATSIPAQPDPAVGGEASTQTPVGVANPPQRPDGSMPVSREAVKAEARAHNRNNFNNLVPKGEASTVVNGQPNAMPQPTGDMSRAQVGMLARPSHPHFGQPSERPDVPTNPADGTGTPK